MVKNLPANEGDLGLISMSGKYLGEGNGSPLQYSCLGNPKDSGPRGRKERDTTQRQQQIVDCSPSQWVSTAVGSFRGETESAVKRFC